MSVLPCLILVRLGFKLSLPSGGCLHHQCVCGLGGRFSHDSRSWRLTYKIWQVGLVKPWSKALLSFQVNSIGVFHEMKGSMSKALKGDLLLSWCGRNSHTQNNSRLCFVVLFGHGVLWLLALQLLGLLSSHNPYLLLNVKPELNLLPLQTNKMHIWSI